MTKREAMKRIASDFTGTDFLASFEYTIKCDCAECNWNRKDRYYSVAVSGIPFAAGSYDFQARIFPEENTAHYSVSTIINGQTHMIRIDLRLDIDMQINTFDAGLLELYRTDHTENEQTFSEASSKSMETDTIKYSEKTGQEELSDYSCFVSLGSVSSGTYSRISPG